MRTVFAFQAYGNVFLETYFGLQCACWLISYVRNSSSVCIYLFIFLQVLGCQIVHDDPVLERRPQGTKTKQSTLYSEETE